MQTPHNIFKKLTVVVLLAFVIFSCKKGEDDPFLSLRSRKSRVEGHWRLKSGTVFVNTLDFSNWPLKNELYNLNNTKFELVETVQGAKPDKNFGAFSLYLTCTKDGNFTVKEQFSSNMLEASGTWSFNEKSNNKKAKSYIYFKIDQAVNGNPSDNFLFNQTSIDFTFRIKELRNKIMVLEMESDIYLNVNNQFQQKYEGTFTFIQD